MITPGIWACTTAADCNDGNDCTTDSCSATTHLCTNAPRSGAACTTVPLGCQGTGVGYCYEGICDAYAPVGLCSAHVCDADGVHDLEVATNASSGCCDDPSYDPTIATTVQATTRRLYTCSPAPQTGVVAGTFDDPARVSAVHGRLLHPDRTPAPGVQVSVVGHPEFGVVHTYADGRFDMAVLGGGDVVLDFAFPADPTLYVPVQRTIAVPTNQHGFLDDVFLQRRPSVASGVTLPAAGGVITSTTWGAPIDDRPARKVEVYAPPSLAVHVYDAAGAFVTDVTNAKLAITELTANGVGPAGMPASLPSTSAYTYALDASVVGQEAMNVRFSAPISYYVTNFLGTNLPAGSVVPAAYYDRTVGAWIPSENGVVLRVVDSHTLSVSESSVVAPPAALGITAAETTGIAAVHAAGDHVWRVRMPHLSVWDFNYGGYVPSSAITPPFTASQLPDVPDLPTCTGGSIIGCEAQTLAEEFGVVGAPFTLHYQSDRARGYKGNNLISLQLKDPAVTLPSALTRIEVKGTVGGALYTNTLTPAAVSAAPTLSVVWAGDASDASQTEGVQHASFDVRYVYASDYILPAAPGGGLPGPPAFGSTLCDVGSCDMGVGRTGTETYLSSHVETDVGVYHPFADGLGGLTPTIHHRYDVQTQTLWLGDGRRVRTPATSLTARGLVDQARMNAALGGGASEAAAVAVAFSPDGAAHLLAGDGSFSLFRLDTDGNLTPEVGVYFDGSGDGGPPLDAAFELPTALAYGPDGSAYVAESDFGRLSDVRIRRIGHHVKVTGGGGAGGAASEADELIIDTFVGDRPGLYPNPDGNTRFVSTTIGWIKALAVGADGTVYASSSAIMGPHPVAAQVLAFAANGEGAPRTVYTFANNSASAMAIGPDGALYVADQPGAHLVVQRIDLTRSSDDAARVKTWLGCTTSGCSPASTTAQQATTVELDPSPGGYGIGGMTVSPTGELVVELVSSNTAAQIIRVDATSGSTARQARIVAGNGMPVTSLVSVGGPPASALTVPLEGATLVISQIAMDGLGNLLVPEGAGSAGTGGGNGVVALGGVLPGFSAGSLVVADPNGSALYEMDGHAHPGRHLRTLDPVTSSASAQTSNCTTNPNPTLPVGSPLTASSFATMRATTSRRSSSLRSTAQARAARPRSCARPRSPTAHRMSPSRCRTGSRRCFISRPASSPRSRTRRASTTRWASARNSRIC